MPTGRPVVTLRFTWPGLVYLHVMAWLHLAWWRIAGRRPTLRLPSWAYRVQTRWVPHRKED